MVQGCLIMYRQNSIWVLWHWNKCFIFAQGLALFLKITCDSGQKDLKFPSIELQWVHTMTRELSLQFSDSWLNSWLALSCFGTSLAYVSLIVINTGGILHKEALANFEIFEHSFIWGNGKVNAEPEIAKKPDVRQPFCYISASPNATGNMLCWIYLRSHRECWGFLSQKISLAMAVIFWNVEYANVSQKRGKGWLAYLSAWRRQR